MANLQSERIQAPSGGINGDASPDYVGAKQAVELVNLLPGVDGKVQLRGRASDAITGITPNASRDQPEAFWSFDDTILVRGDAITWRAVTTPFSSIKANVTATLVEVPLDYRHVRYGNYTYGAIVDAASPQLGRWDGGATAIVPQANAPFQWTDLQVHAQRLFILGGTLPGTTTPVINGSRVLFWTDPDPAADLSLLASWRDDTVTVPVINQLLFDSDDTPVGLAGCGKYMAIIGSRSINILTGSGTSSFAIRNLTKNLGCVDINSIVEVDDGVFFMSDRGLAFCDGATVQIVSDGTMSRTLTNTAVASSWFAASFNHGYIALCRSTHSVSGTCWLFHIATRAWTQIEFNTPAIGVDEPHAVFRTNRHPFVWQSGELIYAERTTAPGDANYEAITGTTPRIEARWRTRVAALGSPTNLAAVKRIFVDYRYELPSGWTDDVAFRVQAFDTVGNELVDTTTVATDDGRRRRFSADCYGEADAVDLVITHAATLDQFIQTVELYDAWIEYTPGQERGTI